MFIWLPFICMFRGFNHYMFTYILNTAWMPCNKYPSKGSKYIYFIYISRVIHKSFIFIFLQTFISTESNNPWHAWKQKIKKDLFLVLNWIKRYPKRMKYEMIWFTACTVVSFLNSNADFLLQGHSHYSRFKVNSIIIAR